MAFEKRINTFQLGEVDDSIRGRVDLPGYHQAADQITNWLVRPSGGLELCPGSIYVGNTTSDAQVKLYPFLRKNGDAYVLVLYVDRIEIIKSNAWLESSGRVADTSIGTAYTVAQFPELTFIQEDDDCYWFHDGVQPKKFTYTSDTSIALAAHSFTGTTFAGSNDYPRSAALYQRRLLVGHTLNAPSSMWGSVPEDEDDFTLASTAWLYDQLGYRGVWIMAWTHLLVGTVAGEWSWGSGEVSDSTLPIVQQVSDHGSEVRQPLFVKGRVLFVERGGVTVREMLFDDNNKAFNARNLTGLSDQILGTSAMLGWAFQKSPRPTVWIVRGDGDLACLTYDVENNIIAWSTVQVSGTVESVCVIPNGVEDQVWLAVKRTINGGTERHVEYLVPRRVSSKETAHHVWGGIQVDNGDGSTITAATAADPVVVTHNDASANFAAGEFVRITDAGGMTELNTTNGGYYQVANPGGTGGAYTVELQDPDGNNIDGTGFTAFTSGGTIKQVVKTVSGLDHLEGETVSVTVDGGEHGQLTVASGSVTLANYANKYSIGKGVNADVVPLGLDTLETMARERSVDRVKIRVMNTTGLSVGPDANNLVPINFRDADTPMDEAPSLFTGIKEKVISKYISNRGELLMRVRAEAPLPATILGVVVETDLGG